MALVRMFAQVVLLACLCCAFAEDAGVQSFATTPVPVVKAWKRLIITYTSDDASLNDSRIEALLGAGAFRLRKLFGSVNRELFELPVALHSADMDELLTRVAEEPDVDSAHLPTVQRPLVKRIADSVVSVGDSGSPNDPRHYMQWPLVDFTTTADYGINAPGAWQITTGDPNIAIAVIDTGGLNHEDLPTLAGVDMVDSPVARAPNTKGRDNDPSDPGDWIDMATQKQLWDEQGWECDIEDSGWHGTHVAGTIGALGNNGIGITGINWNSELVHARALQMCGGFDADITDAIYWAAAHPSVSGVNKRNSPVGVINMSLGGEGECSDVYKDAIAYAKSVGTVVVVAAGNEDMEASKSVPCNCPGVICVGATNRNGEMTAYSNFGTAVTLSAPGGEITLNSDGSLNRNGAVMSTFNAGKKGPTTDSYLEEEVRLC